MDYLAYERELEMLGRSVQYDALHMLMGRKLGSGGCRYVYVNDLNPLQVIKVDMGGHFSNVGEWRMWHELKDTELGKWLAPCDFISPSGSILVQRRTQQPKHFPDWLPSIFCDTKLTNFGVLKAEDGTEHFVCHDYAMLFLDKALEKAHLRFRKTDWWRLGEPDPA